MFNEQRLETVSRSACVSSAETTITIINTIIPTIIWMLIMREREGLEWKGVKDKERKEKKRKRKGAGYVLTNPITHSFIQSILKTPLNSTTIPSLNSSSTHTPPSLISIIQINNNTCLNPQSNPSHINHPSSSSLKSISSSLLSLSLCLM